MAHSIVRNGNEFLVNSIWAGNQTSVSVSSLSGGGFVAVWTTEDAAQDGSVSAIKAQLFNADGTKAGSEFLVNSLKAGSQFVPAVAALAGGGFVVSWSSGDPAQDGDGYAIKAQVFNSTGAQVGSEFLVNTSGAGIQTYPEVAALDNGGFVIGWRTIASFQDVTGPVRAQLFDANGSKHGSEFAVTAANADILNRYDFEGLPGGGFVAVYGASDAALDGSGTGVIGQRFDASGAKVGSAFGINTNTAGGQSETVVARLENGNFVVAWWTGVVAADGSGSAIKAQIFDANWAKLGGEFLVNTRTADSQFSPSIAALESGGFVVTWRTMDATQDGSGAAIKGQWFNSNGTKSGGEFLVNTAATGDQVDAEVVPLANGGFAAVWVTKDTTQDGSGFAIKAQVYGFTTAQPVATDDSVAITGIKAAPIAFSTLLGNDTDADGDVLTITAVSNPVNGSVVISGSHVIFTPNPGFLGTAGFDYQVSDKFGGLDTGRVTVTVAASLVGTPGNDSLTGTAGDDTIDALAGNDVITVNGGSDWVFGREGDDTVIILKGSFTFIGGAGKDTIDGRQSPSGLQLSASSVAGFASAEVWLGSAHADRFTLTNAVLGDAMPGFELRTGAGDDVVFGSSGQDTIDGGADTDSLRGGAGNDQLDGGTGVDTAVFSGARSAYTITQTSPGVFTVTGADGIDSLRNVEYAQFDNQTVRLYPGSGSLVNFATDNPATYMGAIRDFDGNDLGGAAGWRLIGAADANGDGDIDRFFVNQTNGRFAEVGTAPDGKVYFSDYGWAGETRVVGIYVDPLVQSGQVQAGGPFDSQRRFQNDLQIGNIAKVLGAGDYDKNGLQEVYFSLSDKTAYLHAYMHADGNIQYANYQSQQQVIDYLTQNGWQASTYAGWFA